MKRSCLFVLILVAVPSLLALGCDDDGDGTTTVVLYSEPGMDGLVASDGVAESAGASATIGDGPEPSLVEPAQYRRAVVSFDLASLPDGVAIVSATLRIHQDGETSGAPYGEDGLGDVLVDHVSYTAFSADLCAPTSTIDANIGTLATEFVADTWHELDVTVAVTDDVGSLQSGRSQYKLYHHDESNHDQSADTDGWTMGDSPTNRPELVITYE